MFFFNQIQFFYYYFINWKSEFVLSTTIKIYTMLQHQEQKQHHTK
jgi:hypothetical protein